MSNSKTVYNPALSNLSIMKNIMDGIESVNKYKSVRESEEWKLTDIDVGMNFSTTYFNNSNIGLKIQTSVKDFILEDIQEQNLWYHVTHGNINYEIPYELVQNLQTSIDAIHSEILKQMVNLVPEVNDKLQDDIYNLIE